MLYAFATAYLVSGIAVGALWLWRYERNNPFIESEDLEYFVAGLLGLLWPAVVLLGIIGFAIKVTLLNWRKR